MADFISPMMAKPLPDVFDPSSGEWVAEEKLDGHRILVSVDDRPSNLFGDCTTRAWSRYGRDRLLPPHIRNELNKLPNGLYDGELLVPGQRSYGTVVLENVEKLVYVIFDILVLLDKNLTSEIAARQFERRAMLEQIFLRKQQESVKLGWSIPIDSIGEVKELATNVWAQDGEGLILKHKDAVYTPGKRPKNTWYKIKQLRSSVLTVTGFRQGRMGPNSIVLLRDDEGFETTVKWKNYEELDKIEANPQSFIGRNLRIEYQERTPDGSYRHPRWDRWEDE